MLQENNPDAACMYTYIRGTHFHTRCTKEKAQHGAVLCRCVRLAELDLGVPVLLSCVVLRASYDTWYARKLALRC